MIRVSTTTLESFRLFMDPDQDWMTEDALLATIRGEFVPTPAVELGQAFDRVLNTPDAFAVDGGYRAGGYFLADAVMTPALALFDRRGVFQVKATRMYGDVQVVAVADQLIGSRLVENKTTLGTFDFDKYEASAQWKFMAEVFQPTRITYHVFCLSEDHAGAIGLRSIETFDLYPYPALHDDCSELVSQFVAYADRRGLLGLLRDRHALAEAAL